MEEDLLDVFQINCFRTVLGKGETDPITNGRRYEKFGSIPLSRVIIRKRLRWLGLVSHMNDDKSPKIAIVSQPSRAKGRAGFLGWGWKLSSGKI